MQTPFMPVDLKSRLRPGQEKENEER